MHSEEIKFNVLVYKTIAELNKDDAFLVEGARSETQFAYAPYSNFNVGAVARLTNGEIVKGTNQENASYPAGICAERTLMSVASSLFPGIGIETIAISYHNKNGQSNRPISPCGICRQSFAEFQQRTQNPIRILLSGMEGEVQLIENANHLLPLGFSSNDMA
ncbi:MAG: cytidine deaminase [Ginsengibacter sp.]